MLTGFQLTLHATGSAAPHEVWERYAQPQRWSSWSPQIRHVRTSADRIETGLTGRVIGPLRVAIDFTIDDVDEAERKWAWHVTTGPIRLDLHHSVAPHGDGTTTALRLNGPAPVILGYASVAQWALHRLVRR
jgi:hypothetical protein